MKQRSIFAILWLSICLSVCAQTQQGYVKTLGRPNQKGVALSGVSVRLKGGHNAVLSNAQGSFAMPMPGKKPGDAYTLQQVQKQGYELRDKAAVGRQYAYSDKVPLTLVMVSSAQLHTDKQRIENKVYEVAERVYKQRLAALEQQKSSNAITIEQYRQQLQDLQDKFEKYQSLIDGLAEHYALVDYDALDEQEREITLCIENGDLERADSLLQRLGVQQRAEDIAQRLKAGQRLMDEAQQEQAEVMRRQEKDAEYLYQLYTIALAKFDNDKARFYIETRAELDTMNVKWVGNAGEFLHEIVGDYNSAMNYFQRAYRVAQQHEDNHLELSTCLLNIGSVHEVQGRYQQALSFDLRALELIKDSNLWIEQGTSYNNLGNVYRYLSRYEEAENSFKQAINCYAKASDQKTEEKVHRNYRLLATIGLARVYSAEGKFKQAIDLLTTILQYDGNERSADMASFYSVWGDVQSGIGQLSVAIEYYNKAIRVWEYIYGPYHPYVAIMYSNIAASYAESEQYDNALEYHKKSLAIKRMVYGDNHPSTANSYIGIAVCLRNKHMDKEALEYMEKALSIQEECLQGDNINLANTYYNLGACYYEYGLATGDMSNRTRAVDYCRKAYRIIKRVLPEDHPIRTSVEEYLGNNGLREALHD